MASLDCVTPLVLTFNEESNIHDTLARLSWAQRIVVIDSHSTDATPDILREFSNVDVYQREFDHFAEQCNFGLTKIATKWTLSLDADYKCPPRLAEEIAKTDNDSSYAVDFVYCVYGHPIRGNLYPPRIVLFETKKSSYVRDGHAHKVVVSGPVGKLRTKLFHDDRKPISCWLDAQWKYAQQEAEKIREGHDLSWKDRIRRWVVAAPILTFFYCLFVKRLVLDGWRGMYYTIQRVYAELLLSLSILDRRLYASDQIDTLVSSSPKKKIT